MVKHRKNLKTLIAKLRSHKVTEAPVVNYPEHSTNQSKHPRDTWQVLHGQAPVKFFQEI